MHRIRDVQIPSAHQHVVDVGRVYRLHCGVGTYINDIEFPCADDVCGFRAPTDK